MAVRLLLALIRLYQRYLSPILGGQCRFVPSCSRYAAACIEEQGAVAGSLLSVVRVCKCHPLHPGGHDPPPPPRSSPPRVPPLAGAGQGAAGAAGRDGLSKVNKGPPGGRVCAAKVGGRSNGS